MQPHPDKAEAGKLLGTVHAENDDDQQVRGQGRRGERRLGGEGRGEGSEGRGMERRVGGPVWKGAAGVKRRNATP